MKKIKTVVGVNTLANIGKPVYGNHCQFWSKTMKDFPNDEFLFVTPDRMSIDAMRNFTASFALEQDADYLMFIDDDVLVQPETYKSLREADKDVIMALTFIRSYPFRPMLFERKFTHNQNLVLDIYDEYRNNINDNGLVECYAVGFSCVLIKTSLLKKCSKPYFVTAAGHTEDVYFCCKAKKEVEGVSIFVDTKCPTGHVLDPIYVSSENVEKIRDFFKPANVAETEVDRDNSYLKNALDAFEF